MIDTTAMAASPQNVPKGLGMLVLLLALAAGIAAVWGGPPLGDHESIVAQCARNMRVSGDWVVPELFSTPFIRKPPLAYWLVAGASYLFPNDPQTGLPVTAAASRFPSGLAAFGTILLIWKMASVMFGRRAGLVAAIIAASNIFMLLYAPNATVEMILTFCCTWAYFHFWMAVRNCGIRNSEFGISRVRRAMHMLGFYVALGFGMLAKGPAPLAMVAFPLAVWWYTEVPLRILARRGIGGTRVAFVAFIRGLWPRTKTSFTQLWLIPGLVIFLAFFVPWMIAVANRHPHAWHLWNWQYLQRAKGDYEDTRPRGPFYYVPILVGMLVPWLFLLPEAVIAPWLRRYVPGRRALLFAGAWCLIAVAIMSLEPFKKPYYIAPAIPALMLMMALVAEQFYFRKPLAQSMAWLVFGGLLVGMIVGLFVGKHWLHRNYPDVATPLVMIVMGTMACVQLSALAYVYRRPWLAMLLMGVATIGTFNLVWYRFGPILGDIDDVTLLASTLDRLKLPKEAKVYWADKRPDARLDFYFNRPTYYLTEPSDIVSKMVDRTSDEEDLQVMAMDNARKVLESPQPGYLLVTRKRFNMMERFAGIHGKVLDAVPLDPKKPEKDLLIVTKGSNSK